MPTILLYSVPAEQHRQLEALGMRLGYSCKKIARKRFYSQSAVMPDCRDLNRTGIGTKEKICLIR